VSSDELDCITSSGRAGGGGRPAAGNSSRGSGGVAIVFDTERKPVMSHESAAHAKAAASFQQALRLRPDDVAALVWLGEMQLAQDQTRILYSLCDGITG
jgi:hypothetical protein